jgi:hypothetical protein
VAVGVDADAVPGGRCGWSLLKHRALIEAWKAAFVEAGALSFHAVRDPATLPHEFRIEGGPKP